jgi:polyisoprenoid-binding protein YceI
MEELIVLKIGVANGFIALLFIVGCGNDATELATESVKQQTQQATNVKSLSAEASDAESHSASEIIQITDGSVARYKIGEVLTRYPNPIVAIGESDQVSGSVAFDEDGDVLNGSITVDVSVLKSDKNKRDNWIQRSAGIGSEIVLNVTEIEGLTFPLAETGDIKFVILGNLEISGRSVRTSWDASATLSGTNLEGKADTIIKWEQFGLSKPSLPFIISVEDEIILEIEFKASRN